VIFLIIGIVGAILATSGSPDTASKTAATEGPAGASSSPTPAPTPSGVLNLTAKATAFAATLRWDQPAGGPSITAYTIYRNGTQIDRVSAPAGSYHDQDLTPGHKYSYKVVAEAGDVASGPIAISVTTTKPPLAEARVKGLFDIQASVTSSYGYSQIEKSVSFGWKFTPKCKKGPCTVAWKQVGTGGFTSTLERSGDTYTGSYTGHLGVICGSVEVTGTITVSLTVTKAKGEDGSWIATAMKGTASETNPSQVGCVTSHSELALSGKRFS
jgi:hypothetical protein